jgi:hypothetical protein
MWRLEVVLDKDLQGPVFGLDQNATLDMKDHSFSINYSKLFHAFFLIILLLEESNLYCHQYYIVQATSNLL